MIKGKLQHVPIGKIRPNDWNPNEMSKEMLERERKDLERFGIVRSIAVWEPKAGVYEIIDGEHRYKLLLDAGVPVVPVRNLGKISKAEAMALTVVLNETKGQEDFFKMATLFSSVKEFTPTEISEFLPFSPEEITAYIDASSYTFEEFDMSGYSSPSIGSMVSIPCRLKSSDAEWCAKQAAKLAGDLGIKSDKPAVQLGMLLGHLLRKELGNEV